MAYWKNVVLAVVLGVVLVIYGVIGMEIIFEGVDLKQIKVGTHLESLWEGLAALLFCTLIRAEMAFFDRIEL